MQLNAIMHHLFPNFRLPEKSNLPHIATNQSKKRIFPIVAEMKLQIFFKNNRLEITSASLPPCTEAERQEAHANNLEMLANLWHEQNLAHSLAYTEMRMNLLKTILALYRDECDFQAANAVYVDAVSEICAYNNTMKRGTPSENRQTIKSVENWFSLLFTYSEFVPASAFDQAAIYNSGIQIINYYDRLMQVQPEYVAIAFRVIHGASLESVATKYKIKQSEARTQTLYVGQILYRMGFITTDWEDIKPAENIPQIRAKEYVALANLDTLKDLATKAKHEFCLPFENRFGITQVNWQTWERETQQGFSQINQLLNLK